MTDFIIFAIVETWSDIAFVASIASCFAKNSSYQYTEVVKTIFKYLKDFCKQDTTHGKEDKLQIKDYLDSDQAGDKKS